MKRPITFALAIMTLGIIIGQYFNEGWSIALFLLIIAVINTELAILFRTPMLILLSAFAAFGTALGVNDVTPKDMALYRLASDKADAIVCGEIIEKSDKSDGGYMFTVLTDTVSSGDRHSKSLKLLIYSDTGKELKTGDVIKSHGRLSYPEKRKNPVGFDTLSYYRYKHLFCSQNAESIVKTGEKRDIHTLLSDISSRLSKGYEQILPPREAGIVKALILGCTEDIDQSTYDSFRKGGIVHILSISGLHISILSGLLMFLLKPLFKKASGVIALIVLIFYCLLTGCSVATVRAVIMFGAYVISDIFYKDGDIIGSACLACMLLLIYSPSYLYSMGFRFSFGAVFIIGMINDIYGHFGRKTRLLPRAFGVNTGTQVLTVYYFYSFNPLSLFTNLIAVPLVLPIVVFSLISGILSLVNLTAARFCSGIVYVLVNAIIYISQLINSAPLSDIATGGMTIGMLVSVAIITVLFYNLSVGNLKPLHTAICCFICLCVFFACRIPEKAVIFPYVGNADCAVIKGKNYTALADAGSGYGKKAGEKVLLPYLKYLNTRKIDEVFISHLDYDHISALEEIAGKIEIEKVYIAENASPTALSKDLFKTLKENGIPVYTLQDGDTLTRGKIKWEAMLPVNSETSNESSMLMMLDFEQKRFLFTGDTSINVEDEFINRRLKCDVLKLPHHGAKDGTSAALLAAANPKLIVITAGYKNTYSHPHSQTMELIKEYNYHITGYDGELTVKI